MARVCCMFSAEEACTGEVFLLDSNLLCSCLLLLEGRERNPLSLVLFWSLTLNSLAFVWCVLLLVEVCCEDSTSKGSLSSVFCGVQSAVDSVGIFVRFLGVGTRGFFFLVIVDL